MHALLELGGSRLGVEPGRQRLRHPQDQPGVLHVRGDRVGHARVLDLHRHPRGRRAASRGAPARSRRPPRRRARSPRTAPRRARSHSSSSTLRTFFHGIVGACVRSVGELPLVEVAVLGGQELGVDERGELADLHRRALHAPERRRPCARPPPGGGARARPRPPPSSARCWRRGCRRSERPACRPPSPPAPCAGSGPSVSSSRRRGHRFERAASEPGVATLPADGRRTATHLAADERAERGTRATRRLRREGLVPGVVYGGTGRRTPSPSRSTRASLRHVLSTARR